MKVKRFEQYQDLLARLFPDEFNESRTCKSVTLQVTDACNLACTYCYQINKHNNFMSFETVKKFIDTILESKTKSDNPYINLENTGGIVLEFIGGEPLLAIDTIAQISDYFYSELIKRNHPWKNRFMFSICSNGVLYFDPKVQSYLKKWHGLVSFSISIDGNKKLHDACRIFPDGSGSYDIAVKAAKHYLANMDSEIGSKMTLAPQNIDHTFEAVKNLIDIGYEEIHANCVYEQGWTLEHATSFYHQLKNLADYILENDLEEKIDVSIFTELLGCPMKDTDNQNWCGGTGSMIAVDYKGDIYPCLRYMESSLGEAVKPIIIGTVNGGIMETSCQKDCVNCLKCITRRSQSTDECYNCPIAQGCAWCSAYNYQEFGTPDKRATYICNMHKARVLANIYYWNKAYHKHHEDKLFQNNVPENWALEIISQDELKMLNKLCEING